MENNIGKLNSVFMQNINNLYFNKNGVNIIKEYVSLLKKNKPLLKELSVFLCIENQTPNENLKEIINESIQYLDNINKKQLLKLNGEVSKFLEKYKIERTGEIENEKLLEDVHNLIFMKKSLNTINEKVNKLNNIVNYINENNQNNSNDILIEDLNDEFCNILVKKFNEKYADNITESQKEIFKKIVALETEEEKRAVLEEEKKECLNLTNSMIKEPIDTTTKEKLLNVKEKLLEQTYNEQTYIKDIISLIELRETLNT